MYTNSSKSFPVTTQQSPNHNKYITVIGEGAIDVQPDTAVIEVGVTTEHGDVKTAQLENAQLTTNIINSIRALGIAPEDIRTVRYNITVQYDYEDGKQLFKGYRVTHLLKITSKQLSQAGTIIDTAVANGANIVENIEFIVSNRKGYYNQALSNAVKDSIDKANTIARSFSLPFQPTPYHITELSSSGPDFPVQPVQFMANAAVETPITPGQQQVTARVQVKFIF